jgi:hypothetical protein
LKKVSVVYWIWLLLFPRVLRGRSSEGKKKKEVSREREGVGRELREIKS